MSKYRNTVRAFIARHRSFLIVRRIVIGILFSCALFFISSSLLHAVFGVFPWIALPFVWDVLLLGEAVFLLYWIVDSTIFHAPGLITTAKIVENHENRTHSLLSIALELDSKSEGQSESLTRMAQERAASEIIHFPERLPFRISRYILLSFGAGLIAWIAILFLIQPRLISFWDFPFSFNADTKATIDPGTIAIPQNGSCTLRLHPSMLQYPSCRLEIKSLDRGSQMTHLLRPDTANVFMHRIDTVRLSFSYRFSLGPHVFGPETVTVIPPPTLYSLQVSIIPPSYINRPKQLLREGQGSFSAYAGSRVSFSIGSGHLKNAWLLMGDDSVALSVESDSLFGETTIWKECEYSFALTDTLGQKNDSLPHFHIGIVEDEKPLVHFLKPAHNKACTPALVETLWVEGIDDIGIKNMHVYWHKNTDSSIVPWNIPVSKDSRLVRKQLVWDLSELSLYPGDTVFYWARIRDSKPYGNPQIAQTDTFWFRVPGFEEIHRSISEQENYVEKSLGEVKEKQNDVATKLDNFFKSATGTEELTWEQKQVLKDVQKNLEAQSDSLTKAVKALEESIQKMKEQGLQGNDVVKKMEQIQHALKEILEQYGDSLLYDFEKNEADIGWEEMKEAVEKIQDLLPDLEERLDQTLAFLETLKKDQELASLALKAEHLGKEQTNISFSKDLPSRQMERQKDLLDRIEALSKDLNEQFPENDGLHSTKKIDSLKNKMNDQLSHKRQPSGKTMRDMGGNLFSLSNELRQKLSAHSALRMQKERDLLLRMANDAITMARWQTDLAEKAQHKKDDPQLAQAQQALNDALKKSMAKTDSFSVLPPHIIHQMNEDFGKCQSSSNMVTEALGHNSRVAGFMERNTESLHALANSLLEKMSALEGPKGQQGQGMSGGGMMSGLRKLSGKQAAVNAATADLLRSMMQQGQGQRPGQGKGQKQGQGQGTEEGGSAAGADEAKRAAQEAQDAIADELRRLADNYGEEAGEGLTDRVKKLEKEAKRLARMLENPNAEVSERQDRFLARMLQSTLSLHREGEGKEERKSQKAESIYSDRSTVSQGEILKDIDTFHRIRRKAFQSNFPERYRPFIKAYFDSLGTLFLDKQPARPKTRPKR